MRPLSELPPLEQWIDEMLIHYAEGKDDVEVMSDMRISMKAFKAFMENSEAFEEAVSYGRQLSQSYWHKLARTGVYKDLKIDPAILKANLAHRHNWSDKVETKAPEGPQLSLQELQDKVQQKLLALIDGAQVVSSGDEDAQGFIPAKNDDITDIEE